MKTATRMRCASWLLAAVVVAVVVAVTGTLAGVAAAHPLAPALLELREQPNGRVEVRFKTTRYVRSRRAAERLAPILPDSCRRVGEVALEMEGTGRVQRWTLACDEPLTGQVVGVGGLGENAIDALLRVQLEDGRSLQRVLRAGASTVEVPVRPSRVQVFSSYLDMGARHIFSGLDHLLFVLGLVLLVAPGPGYLGRLLLTLSAFTVGHCATLSLAALNWVRVPGPPVEFAIALSVLLLAVELARPTAVEGAAPDAVRTARLPWLLAGGFGLLHGLGFAGALVEAGLPEGEILLALLSFNVGIEVGQVAFVCLVLAARGLLHVLRSDAWLPTWAPRLPVYVMGSLAAMWCIERARNLFP